MLKFKFIIPKQRRKTTKRSRSPSPAVSEHSEPSTESEAPMPTTTKEPEVVEVAEPTLSQDSTGDNPISPSQLDPKKHQKNTSVILSDDEETRVVEWLADRPLMYNKKIKEYKKEKVREELRYTGRNKLIFYLLLLLVLGQLYC